MEKNYKESDYNSYMRVLQYYLDETEKMLEKYEIRKKLRSLSFEDWVKYQKGELKIYETEKD